jgi:FkbM family methyltransferase
MDPAVALKLLEGSWSSEQINWEGILAAQYRAALVAPATIVDVGANIGAHVAYFVNMGCPRVVAFEPIPELAAQLAANYPDAGLTVHPVALAERAADAVFLVDREVLAESGLKGRVDRPERHREEIPVEVRTLDSYGLESVDYIKIDVEGADLLVLAGAESTIMSSRPLISVEYGWAGYQTYGFGKQALLDWALRHCYVVCDLFGGDMSPQRYDACVDRYYWDYLLRPLENRDLSLRLESNGEAVLAAITEYIVA